MNSLISLSGKGMDALARGRRNRGRRACREAIEAIEALEAMEPRLMLAVDLTPPKVIDVTAMANGTIFVDFSERMDSANVDNGADVWVTDGQGQEVPGSIAWNDGENTLRWQSDALPDAADTWTITLAGQDSSDFVDWAGNILDGDGDGGEGPDFEYTWDTGPAGDTTPPTVTDASATSDGTITFAFSEPMDAANVDNESDVWVVDSDG